MNSPFVTLAPDGRTIFWFQTKNPITLKQTQKSINRKRMKEQKALPLFANIIDQVSNRIKTEDQLIELNDHRFDKLAQSELRNYQYALILRTIVGKFVTPDELTGLDEIRFNIYPASIEYSWGFWFNKLKELAPVRAYELCLNKENHILFAKWHDLCPTCGKSLKSYKNR